MALPRVAGKQAEISVRDYQPEPTARLFHNDNSDVRGLMGPVGTGKTVVCCMEAWSRILEQPPGKDGIRRSRWAFIRNCFDDQTEILTEHEGWKLFKNLHEQDRVAMRDKDGRMVFVKPTMNYQKHYTGKMQGWKGEQLDFLTTPDHNHWFRKKHGRAGRFSEPQFVKTDEAFLTHDKYRVQRDVEEYDGCNNGHSERMFEFLGYWWAEGRADAYPRKDSRGMHLRWTLTSFKDIKYVRTLLGGLAIPFRECRRSEGGINFELDPRWDMGLFKVLTECGHATDKHVPGWIKCETRENLQAFIRGFKIGDGSSVSARHKSDFLYTSSKQLADDLQEMCAKAGMVVNINMRDRTGRDDLAGFKPTAPEYMLTICKPSKHRPRLSRAGWYEVDYDGMVYCVEVPTHVIYVRRSGRAFWSSQTYPELLSTTMKTWQDWVPDELCHINMSAPITGKMRFWLPDKTRVQAEIIFIAIDRAEDVRKLKSLELTGAFLNEASELDEQVKNMALQRTGRYPAKIDGGDKCWTGIIMDTNPPPDDHWWHELAEVKKPVNHSFYRQPPAILPVFPKDSSDPITYVPNQGQVRGIPAAENVKWQSLGYEYWLRQAHGADPEWVKVYLMGEYGSIIRGKPVYPEYSDAAHYSKEPIDVYRGLPIIIGWDFGLCYTDDTEVLTDRGWKLFKDVDENSDLAATRDPQTGEMEYTRINFKVDRQYKGDMLEWANQSINFCVTPEHRVPFSYRDTPDVIHFESAEWLEQHAGGHHHVDVTSQWDPYFDDTQTYFGMDPITYVGFMGMYLSEGSLDGDRISIYQNSCSKPWDDALAATGLPWKYEVHGKCKRWRVKDRRLAEWLSGFGKASGKYVPADIKAMPAALIREFIRFYTEGDGHIRTRPNGSKEHTIFTTSKLMADDLQELCQKAGWNASIRRTGPTSSTIHEEAGPRVIKSSGGYSITVKKRARRAELLKRNFRRIKYDGRIYCLNVPYHTLYVRRGGKAHWNGNTPACAFVQATPKGTVQVFDECVSTDMELRRFVEEIVNPLVRTKYYGIPIVSVGDPAGDARSQTDGRTCMNILQECGIPTVPASTNNPIARRDAIKYYLTRMTEGRPSFTIGPGCPVLRKAFLGEYQFKEMRIGGLYGRKRFHEVPDKNFYSHISDALQYAFLQIRDGFQPGDPQMMRNDTIRPVRSADMGAWI